MKHIQIRGENVKVTQALKEYANEKLGRLERYFEEPFNQVYVNLKVYKVGQKVEVTIPLTGLTLRAEEKADDLYAALDLVIDKLERQIRKHKTKIQKKVRQKSQGKRIVLENTDELSFDETLVVSRKKSFDLKPMDEEEAILQMELLGHEFYVFVDHETNKPSIVYKRKDGLYGLIETA